MTARGVFALLQRLLIVVVLAAAGAYLVIYLYRWEWNRALISGIVFVSAEVALATTMISNRLDRAPQDTASFDLALARLREANVDRRSPFRWLTPRDRLGVFVPVLLGAGVVLSAIAYVVERVAAATAHVTVDRRLAHRLALLTPSRTLLEPAPATLQWSRPSRRVGPLAGLVAVGVLAASAVNLIAEATASRPDASDRPAATTIELVVEQKTASTPLDTASALWVACRPTLSRRTPPTATLRPAGQRVLLELRPGIRELETRRLTGCLRDATLRLVRAEVVSVRHTRV